MIKKNSYLSVTQVLAIHDQMIKRFGGSKSLRDINLLESAIGGPHAIFDGKDLYVSLFDKAAALLQSLLKNYPFVDGNKRTTLTSTGIFLQINEYKLLNYHEEEIEFAIKVDNEQLTISDISKWLKNHSEYN